MKALKYYVSMLITCALIMGIGSSAYAKDDPSKGNASTTSIKGVDGNKKDGVPDKDQNIAPIKAGSTTPTRQIQATDQGSMQALKQLEELSDLMRGMRKSVQEIDSKQDELRKDVERFSGAKNGDWLSDVPLFVGAIAVILGLMVILFLIYRAGQKLEDIKMNLGGGSFSEEQIKQINEIKDAIGGGQRSSGNGTQTFMSWQQINDIAEKVHDKLGLSKKLDELANQHFGAKGAKLDEAVRNVEAAVEKMRQTLSSVDTLKTESQKITLSAGSLKDRVQEVIDSLNTARTDFTNNVQAATSSFCNAEAVSVLPKVQRLIEDLGGTLTKTNLGLEAKVRQLEEDAKASTKTIGDKDEKIKELDKERRGKIDELKTERDDHQKDNDTKDAEILRLNGVITGLQLELKKTGAEKDAAQTSFAGEQARREEVEAEKGRLEEVIANRDEWNQSLFPSWFKDQSLKSLHDALCSEFVSESPSTESLLFRAALLELKAMELKGVPDGIESLLTRLGRYCFAYLSEKKYETRDAFEVGRSIATLVSESNMINPTGVYVRVPRMGGQVDLQWMRSPSNERTIQAIRTWSVWTTQNGLYSKAEVN